MSYELIIEYYQQIQDILSNNYFQEYGVIRLFLNSLLSATAIPIPTEILTLALLIGGEHCSRWTSVSYRISDWGVLNYFIGFGGSKLFKKIKRKTDIETNEKNKKILDKFGWSTIFFAAWIPVMGDLILISAGIKKMKFVKFSIFMVWGKIVKTIIVVVGLGTIF